jgi:hypothetical protein
MTVHPLPCRWTGDALEPIGRFKINADREFVVGQHYIIAPVENDHSSASRRHYFACLDDIWMSLPDGYAERFPTMTHMRKHALIECGYANSRQYVAKSKAEALRVLSFMGSKIYSIVAVKKNVITEWTARSQAKEAMDAKMFQESKTAVLDYCAGLIGVASESLTKAEEYTE